MKSLRIANEEIRITIGEILNLDMLERLVHGSTLLNSVGTTTACRVSRNSVIAKSSFGRRCGGISSVTS